MGTPLLRAHDTLHSSEVLEDPTADSNTDQATDAGAEATLGDPTDIPTDDLFPIIDWTAADFFAETTQTATSSQIDYGAANGSGLGIGDLRVGVGVGVPALVILLASIFFCVWRRRRQRRAEPVPEDPGAIEELAGAGETPATVAPEAIVPALMRPGASAAEDWARETAVHMPEPVMPVRKDEQPANNDLQVPADLPPQYHELPENNIGSRKEDK
ncbi:hypothetical protein H4R19_001107 [Coemansia spiralis]|nr:hypothetical protein H4R19_001107 [Coemansia spiralis]